MTPIKPGWRGAVVVTLAASAVRVIVAASTPLFPDETYYWEWSRHLSAGYFDHPPAIAWLIRIGTLILGNTPLGVRAGALAVGTIGILFICLTARRMAGDHAAFLCALIFAVMPLSAAGLILATPDAPLVACIAAATYGVVRALQSSPGSRDSFRWWTFAGLALGLGLVSKYTAALLPLGVFIALLTHRDLSARLREPGPYAATLLALLIFAPVIFWNAAHGWVSFAFQLQHGLGAARGSALNRELELVGGQLGLVSPILFVLCVIAVSRARRAGTPILLRLLAVTAAVVFAFFMYSATRRRVEPNWPAIAYVPAILLLVAQPASAAWNRWLRGGMAVAALLTIVTYVNAFVPILPVPARRDPAARAHGWEALAAAVQRIRAPRLPISSHRTWIAADRYQEASQLAFHLPDNPETFSLNLTSRVNMYDLWPAFPARAYPRDGLILVVDDVEGTHPTTQLLAPHFTSVRKDELVPLSRGGDETKRLRIWVLDGWRGTWPQRPLRSRQ